MSKVKTQYGDLTEKQWKVVVVEKLVAIEKLLIKVAEMSAWSDDYKKAVAQMERQKEVYKLNCYKLKRKKEKANA